MADGAHPAAGRRDLTKRTYPVQPRWGSDDFAVRRAYRLRTGSPNHIFHAEQCPHGLAEIVGKQRRMSGTIPGHFLIGCSVAGVFARPICGWNGWDQLVDGTGESF